MIASFLWAAALLQAPDINRLPEVARSEFTRNIAAWIARADRNADSRLSREEWQGISSRTFPDMSEAYVRRMAERDIDYFDRNRDGMVDLAELSGPSLMGFDCLDTDRNGRLSSAERASAATATCLPTRTIAD